MALVDPAGFAVETFDARGHGRSGGTRVFVERFDSYLEDLALAIGTLEIAKDVIKSTMSAWHMKDAQRKARGVRRAVRGCRAFRCE